MTGYSQGNECMHHIRIRGLDVGSCIIVTQVSACYLTKDLNKQLRAYYLTEDLKKRLRACCFTK